MDQIQKTFSIKLNVKELKKIVHFFLVNAELHGNECKISLDSELGKKLVKMPFHCSAQDGILVRLTGTDGNYVEDRLQYGGRSDWVEIDSNELTQFLNENEGLIDFIEIFAA